MLRLLALTVHKCPVVVTSVGASLVHMLHKFEHVATPIADCLALLTTELADKQLVGDIIRDIGRIDTSTAKDNTGIRNVASFIVRGWLLLLQVWQRAQGCADPSLSLSLFLSPMQPELAMRLPSVLLANISVMLGHLDGESYNMRSAVVTALAYLVQEESSSAPEQQAEGQSR